MPLSVLGNDAAQNWHQGLSTEVAPNGLMVFMFRYLLFRLMFGFGKLKVGGNIANAGYLIFGNERCEIGNAVHRYFEER